MSRVGSVVRHLALATIPVLLLLLLLEALVRLTDADQPCPNRFSASDASLWVCDPVLHFKSNPSVQPENDPLNSLGFRGPELSPPRPGLKRVVALGDSCTFGVIGREEGMGTTMQAYPLKLQRYVERRAGEGVVSVLNAGTPGYNSHHGILLLRSKLRGLDPDLVTVRYGWNDHFLSAAGESSLYREPSSRLGLFAQNLAMRTRLYGFLRRLGLELAALRRPVKQQAKAAFRQQKEWRPTIPPERYAANLRRIVALGREQGAEVWLLTSPRNHHVEESERRLLGFRNKIDFDELMEVHDAYNDITRRVGLETGAPVIDMDKIYQRYQGTPVFLPSDAVHPAQGGQNLEAEMLYRALVRRGWVTPRAGSATPSRGGPTNP